MGRQQQRSAGGQVSPAGLQVYVRHVRPLCHSSAAVGLGLTPDILLALRGMEGGQHSCTLLYAVLEL